MTTDNLLQPDPHTFTGRYSTYDVSVDKKKWRAFLAIFLGNVMERYDYALYGHMSALLTSYFFKNQDPTVAMIQHFSVFAVGFLTRPLGAYVFGCIGDKMGRKYALRWSILGITVPTFLIGCLRSYDEWGWMSPLLLVLLRMAQGTFVAAESDGAEIFVYETISKKFSGFSGGVFCMSGLVGSSLAAFIAGVISQSFMPIWAWRMPFILAGIMGCIMVYFRKYLVESYDYIRYRNNSYQQTSQSFLSALKSNRTAMFISFLINGSMSGVNYFYFFFWNPFLHKNLHLLAAEEACFRTSTLGVITILAAPLCGRIIDYFHISISLRFTSVLCVFMTILNGVAIHYGKAPFSLMAVTIITMIAFQVSAQILRLKIFSVGERYRCASMGHALGTVVLSSTSPLIGAKLWQIFKNPVAPLGYVLFLLLIGFLVSFLAKPVTESGIASYRDKPELDGKEMEAFVDSEHMIDIDKPAFTARLSDFFRLHPDIEEEPDQETDNIIQFPKK